jgi:hypothetical protein
VDNISALFGADCSGNNSAERKLAFTESAFQINRGIRHAGQKQKAGSPRPEEAGALKKSIETTGPKTKSALRGRARFLRGVVLVGWYHLPNVIHIVFYYPLKIRSCQFTSQKNAPPRDAFGCDAYIFQF